MTWLQTAKAKKDLAGNDASAKSLVVKKKKNDRSVAVMCAGQNQARPQKVRDNDGTESESTACEQGVVQLWHGQLYDHCHARTRR